MCRSWFPAWVIKLSFHSFFAKTSENELWMVDLGLLLFFPFPFPFIVFYSKPAIMTFGWKDLGFPFSHFHVLSLLSFQKPPNMNFGWVDVEAGARSNTYTHLIVSIFFIVGKTGWRQSRTHPSKKRTSEDGSAAPVLMQ